MKFEWDEEKEKINIVKHGIDFRTAAQVFLDKNRIEYYDQLHSIEEDRYITIGIVGKRMMLITLAYTERMDIIRIISARLATRKGGFMKMVTYELKPGTELTKAQEKMLIDAENKAVVFDEDSPELSEEELAQFYRISQKNREERRKQTVTIRLSPQALKTAKSLGKGYTSVLSRILENALKDKDMIQQYL